MQLLELKKKLQSIFGLSIKDLAQKTNTPLPYSLKTNKGYIGNLIEKYLGVLSQLKNAQSPDFPKLGIELKTIPIDYNKKVLETTFVSYSRLKDLQGISWRNSFVYKKINHILWIPILVNKNQGFQERKIGQGFFHRLNQKEEQNLQKDWEEITENILLGRHDLLNSRLGEYLQIRPKSLNNKAKTKTTNQDGDLEYLAPKGFYLKKNFTQKIIDKNFS